jgi:RNA-directed DNA polymerase
LGVWKDKPEKLNPYPESGLFKKNGGGVTTKNTAKKVDVDSTETPNPSVVETPNDKSRSILDLSYADARDYFLKPESYCNFDLPYYFDFAPLLAAVANTLGTKNFSDFKQGNPRDYEDVNYKVLNNKDGKYAWRPLQLIHPALYVALVSHLTTEENWQLICQRFQFFAENPKIECISIPRESLTKNSDKAEQISNWWQQIEQRSLEMALDYECLTHTDITDCYGAIYTHSVAWALHNKDFIKQKENRNNMSLLGNIIDSSLQDMSHGQTNGIPQGSTLMDFVAEMVLGYADRLLSEKIPKDITDFKILRYRDDYRIFTNNSRDGEQIVKCLTEVMIGLGLKLSAEKTKYSNDIISGSIKSDKRYWIRRRNPESPPLCQGSIKSDKCYWIRQKQSEGSLQKHLLIIHELAKQYPNSGSLTVALNDFYFHLLKTKQLKESIVPMVSISADIAHKNPRTYPYVSAIVSYLLSHIKHENQKVVLLQKIVKKFQNIPNTGHLLIWLQRVALGIKNDLSFEEPICKLITAQEVSLWNN